METVRVAIVGMGPRGLSVLERMAQLLADDPINVELHVEVVEPGECGQGSHSPLQPGYLLTNTVASQVGIFAQQAAVAREDRMSLTEWARSAGYRKLGSRYLPIGVEAGAGDQISDHDHLPRCLLGEYLIWASARVALAFARNVRIKHHRRRVVDLIRQKEGGFVVCLDNGFRYFADYVVLATGHGTRVPTATDLVFAKFARTRGIKNSMLEYFASAYPTERLAAISEHATVAVRGMGLTAYDVVATLTVGRGGRFVTQGDGLCYLPSGREPKLLLFSRSCLPFAARGINQKGIAGQHQARFFTAAAINALRGTGGIEGVGRPQLDFVAQVLPLVMKEMAYAYRSSLLGGDLDPVTFEPTKAELDAIASLLNPLQGSSFHSFEAFKGFFRRLVEVDLAEARKGNLASPLKAAADVLRDAREALRAAVEFSGLTPASHRVYVEEFVSTINRITFGPPWQRNAELLALMDAGVVDVAGGPGNHIVMDVESGRFCIINQFGKEAVRHAADVLVIASLDIYSPETDSSRLTRNLMRRRTVRPYRNGGYHPGGLDIDPEMRVIDSGGKTSECLWAIGIPAEGAHFYTHALPRPMLDSRFTRDAQSCASQLLALMRQRYDRVSVGEPAVDMGDAVQ